MAAPAVINSQYTVFTIEDADGDAVVIDGIKGISGLGSGTAAERDDTVLSSTAKEISMGLRDEGSFTLMGRFNLDDPGQAEMDIARATQDPRVMTITLPSSTKRMATFTAYVMAMGPGTIQVDASVELAATVRITGPITWSVVTP